VTRKARAKKLARRNALVEAHQYLVAPIARMVARTLPPSIEIDDLIGAGQLGLIQAADAYHPQKHGDCPFEAYAKMRIRGAMLDSVRRRHYRNATHGAIEDAPEPAAVQPIEEAIDRRRIVREVHTAVAALADERHRKVIVMHDLWQRKLEEVGNELGVCASRASQLHVEALEELRKNWRLRDKAA
jgi:RNA polymerase sigma factor (sigma-70 family)